eukprot:scaffold153968_cov22-Prasinocladus_malaysianus.AAC.1
MKVGPKRSAIDCSQQLMLNVCHLPRDYEPSEAGTGVSGHTTGTSIGGEGVGLRVARPVPGASAAVAEKVLGRLGEAGGRRARNR